MAEDGDFIFHGAFRFSRKLIDRCMEAGHRAYRHALAETPTFLPALDEALREARAGGDGRGGASGHSADSDAAR